MRIALVLGCLTLAACGNESAETAAPEPAASARSAAFETLEGETRGSIASADGSVASMTSGPKAPAKLPDGFTVAPGLTVLNSTSVTRGKGSYVMLTMEGPVPVSDIVAFYRKQAEAAGITLTVDVVAPKATTIGGEGAGGRTFSLIATRSGENTGVQLTLSRGLK